MLERRLPPKRSLWILSNAGLMRLNKVKRLCATAGTRMYFWIQCLQSSYHHTDQKSNKKIGPSYKTGNFWNQELVAKLGYIFANLCVVGRVCGYMIYISKNFAANINHWPFSDAMFFWLQKYGHQIMRRVLSHVVASTSVIRIPTHKYHMSIWHLRFRNCWCKTSTSTSTWPILKLKLVVSFLGYIIYAILGSIFERLLSEHRQPSELKHIAFRTKSATSANHSTPRTLYDVTS